jgi:Bacterial Ig-like domain
VRRLILVVALLGCASMGPIPGGPELHTQPKILAVLPDTNAVNFHGKAVEFRFDRVINYSSGPKQDLTGLFLISPRDGEPRVDWHRERIDVRPLHDWLPDIAYRITLLPGMSDLAGNVLKTPYTMVFSTGPTLPDLGVTGRVFDWSTGRVAPNAVVEAILDRDSVAARMTAKEREHPDTVRYIALADTAGLFHLGPFGPGTYTVVGFVDANKNLSRDVGEIWDSTHVVITTASPTLELLAAKRDTVGPRITTVAADDSVTLRVTVDHPLDPAAPLDTGQFRIMSSDSAHLTALSVRTLAEYDTARARAHADSVRVADSLAAVRDTLKRAAPKPKPAAPKAGPEAPKPSRPSPATILIIDLAFGSHLKPLTQYRVTATDLVNLLGYKATSTRVFATPKPPAPPDTIKQTVKPDTGKRVVKPDSAAKAKPDTSAGKGAARRGGGGTP